MKPPISDQVEAAQAAALLMCSLWRGWVGAGKMSPEECDEKCEALHASIKTLAWVRDHADVIRSAHATHLERTERVLREAVERIA